MDVIAFLSFNMLDLERASKCEVDQKRHKKTILTFEKTVV